MLYFSTQGDLRFKGLVLMTTTHIKSTVSGTSYQKGDRLFHSFANVQNMQFADFLFKCLNKAAPNVLLNLFEKVDHKKPEDLMDVT